MFSLSETFKYETVFVNLLQLTIFDSSTLLKHVTILKVFRRYNGPLLKFYTYTYTYIHWMKWFLKVIQNYVRQQLFVSISNFLTHLRNAFWRCERLFTNNVKQLLAKLRLVYLSRYIQVQFLPDLVSEHKLLFFHWLAKVVKYIRLIYHNAYENVFKDYLHWLQTYQEQNKHSHYSKVYNYCAKL